jgi:hypothetical protein
VEVSARTHRRSVALKQLRKIEECIEEHGQYPAPEPKPRTGEPTFLSAAVAYMQAGGRRKYIAPLIKHFRDKPLSEINQKAIDDAAIALYPRVSPATRNCYVYTPVTEVDSWRTQIALADLDDYTASAVSMLQQSTPLQILYPRCTSPSQP